MTYKDKSASPNDAIVLEESLPITFAEMAPPIEILFPPGTEYKVIFFFIFFITSDNKAPASTSMVLF